MVRRLKICVVVALISATVAMLTSTPTPVTAHSGATDSAGCHSDGTSYHCHTGLLAGCSFRSQADMLAQLQQYQGRPPVCTPITTTTGTGTGTGTTTTTVVPPTKLIFPQIADGHFTDGTYYRSTLLISSTDGSEATGCNLQLQGMSATFDGLGTGNTFKFDVDARGWLITSTPGVDTFRFGFATLLCDVSVNAQVIYGIYDKSGKKLSEATVFPSDGGSAVQLLADNREGARLALAIANPAAGPSKYTITVSSPEGGELNTGTVTIPSNSSTAQFLDEILGLPDNYFGQVVITGSEKVHAMGLRFTGPIFTTIPASVRIK